jgi:hypothetical protein
MPLNREGIEQLKADLRANARHYNQQRLGEVNPDCGTETCLAGMCLMRSIGHDEFTLRVLGMGTPWEETFSAFKNDCFQAASSQIGLTMLAEEEYEEAAEGSDGLPPIFSSIASWPAELSGLYEEASRRHDHEAMVEIACVALDRIDENGFFI